MDIIKETIEIWNDGIMGKVVVSLVVFVLIIIAAMVVWFLYWAADSWFVEKRSGRAEIISRRHKNAYYTMVTISNGKTTTVVPQYHPERWLLTLQTEDGKTDEISVSENNYNLLENGDKLFIEFKTGRISEGLYVTSWEAAD